MCHWSRYSTSGDLCVTPDRDWAHLRLWLCSRSVVSNSLPTPWAVACQAPLSVEFSRQEYCRGLPCPSPGDFPDPGIKPASPPLAGGFFTTVCIYWVCRWKSPGEGHAEESMHLNCGVGEDSWESLGLQGDQPWDFFGRNDAKAETPVFWPPYVKSWLIGKDSDAGRDWGQEEEGTTEDEMAGWHHWLDGHECEWTPGVGDGQGGLACCNLWSRKESDMTERLNWADWFLFYCILYIIFLLY